MRALTRLIVVAAALLAAAPAQAQAATEIHAHRGGPLAAGAPDQPEDAQPAFDNGHGIGADWIELDSKLTRDGVPVIIHDATLDRTTNCTGEVADKTAAELEACRVDVLGTDSTIRQIANPTVAIPKLADVLAWAKAEDVKLNLEIKNLPTDPDYDPTPAFARRVLETVVASGIPRDWVLIQSFWPPNLDEAKLAGFRTSLLTLKDMNEQGIEFAQARGYDVVSPAWPVSREYVQRAHAAGKPVVPYTFNKPEEVLAAVAVGVDAVITNDVIVAQRVIYGRDCPALRVAERSLTVGLARARRARDRARSRRARRAAAEGVRRVNLKRRSTKRMRLKVCTPGL